MKDLFKDVKITKNNLLSKKDIKKCIADGMVGLNVKESYKIIQLSNKVKFIIQNSNGLVLNFVYLNTVFPTIRAFDESKNRVIILDSGVIEPLKRGANVMIPGIFKFPENSNFSAGEIVGIKIKDSTEIFAVGKTIHSYEKMVELKTGEGIDIFHIKGDYIDSYKQLR